MTSRGQTFGGGVRRAARNTPARRDRYVDFLRALAILLVVVGHWLAVVIVSSNGMTGENALAELAWARPMTWLFQVMPVFFLVGGTPTPHPWRRTSAKAVTARAGSSAAPTGCCAPPALSSPCCGPRHWPLGLPGPTVT